MKDIYNLLLFIAICFVIYVLFRSFHYNPSANTWRGREGMTSGTEGEEGNKPSSTLSSSGPSNGIAGNAASYGAALNSATIQMQDTFLISKYRSDYETAVLNLDDFIDHLMLKTALSVNQSNPSDSILQLSQLQQAKVALNSVMKFIDSQ